MSVVRLLARVFTRALRPATPRPAGRRLAVCRLEDRAVPAAVRSIDGSGNNLARPDLGQANTDLIRVAPAAYADGLSAPAGASRPSARVVSNAVADQTGTTATSDRLLSAMVYAWGQFIDHDLDNTKTGTGAFNIAVPTGDPSFDPTGTGTQSIPLTRSAFDPATGTTTPRQQVNTVTAWLDGSMVYGSDATTAASLRTFQGGQLKTSAGNLLPTDAAGNFLAGDARVNENPELSSLQTLFLREHNAVAARIAKANPRLSDEQVFQQARAWVIGELQAITYNEWLPALVGSGALPAYRGYNPRVNPSIANEFATAGFRFGHSIVGDDIEFLADDGSEVADAVSLAEAFFNPSLVKANGIDPILKYLASDPSQELDTKVVDSLRNFLFGSPGAGGLDLASLNIQRGRDHGLADYNTTRAAYGLPRVTSFAQITPDTATQAKLKTLYGSVDDIDLWVGALAEKHVAGGSVGPTLRAIIVDQFARLRDGDRFWYQQTFTGADRAALDRTTLASVVERNTTLRNVQPDAFYFRPQVSGTVFVDENRDGRLNPGDRPLAGQTVQLLDAAGVLVATSVTDAAGRYKFGVADGLGVGTYQVRLVRPDGTTTPAQSATMTRGDSTAKLDFATPPHRGNGPWVHFPGPPPGMTFDLPGGVHRPGPHRLP